MAFRSLASDGTCVPRGGRTAEARVAFDPKHQSRRPWLTRVTDFCLRAGLTRVRVRNSYSVLVHLEYFFRFFGLGIFPRTRPFLHYITLHYIYRALLIKGTDSSPPLRGSQGGLRASMRRGDRGRGPRGRPGTAGTDGNAGTKGIAGIAGAAGTDPPQRRGVRRPARPTPNRASGAAAPAAWGARARTRTRLLRDREQRTNGTNPRRLAVQQHPGTLLLAALRSAPALRGHTPHKRAATAPPTPTHPLRPPPSAPAPQTLRWLPPQALFRFHRQPCLEVRSLWCLATLCCWRSSRRPRRARRT